MGDSVKIPRIIRSMVDIMVSINSFRYRI